MCRAPGPPGLYGATRPGARLQALAAAAWSTRPLPRRRGASGRAPGGPPSPGPLHLAALLSPPPPPTLCSSPHRTQHSPPPVPGQYPFKPPDAARGGRGRRGRRGGGVGQP